MGCRRRSRRHEPPIARAASACPPTSLAKPAASAGSGTGSPLAARRGEIGSRRPLLERTRCKIFPIERGRWRIRFRTRPGDVWGAWVGWGEPAVPAAPYPRFNSSTRPVADGRCPPSTTPTHRNIYKRRHRPCLSVPATSLRRCRSSLAVEHAVVSSRPSFRLSSSSLSSSSSPPRPKIGPLSQDQTGIALAST